MTGELILWRCLHGGPLSQNNIERYPSEQAPDWKHHRAINIPILKRLIRAYGTCAMLAWDSECVVGFLRFYPKAVLAMEEAGSLCMQQYFPAGPSESLGNAPLPAVEDIEDKTLAVHCLMTGSPQQEEKPYQRVGLGTRMVRALIRWARDQGWCAIEANSFEDIPLYYGITGGTGKSFWEKLGFRCVASGIANLQEAEAFYRERMQQATDLGLAPEAALNTYAMRLELV